LWESIAEFDEKLTRTERIEGMLRLLGRLPEDEFCDRWFEWQMDQLGKGPKLEQADRYGLMLAVSALNADADRYVRLCDELRKAGLTLNGLGSYSSEFRFESFELFCLGSVGRWNDVAERWRKDVAQDPSDPMKQAYLAGALRRSGREEEAKIHDEMAERLALGDPRTMRSIGQAYASSVDFERGMEWWMRAATQSVDVDQEFLYAASLVAEEAKQRNNWQLAASMGEMLLLYQVMKGEASEQPTAFSRGRLEVEMARAFSRVKEDREESIKVLTRCHETGPTDGSMADFFFPGLRQVGLIKQHDEWFESTWDAFGRVLKQYPKSHNTMNSAAWTAARSNRRLPEAKVLLEKALTMMPRQAAYLDTMGEIHFAQGDREKALEWSRRGVVAQPGDETLLRQHDRFDSDPFPGG
jgi:tetratricopeptide (TPR) repeat protein